jgi:hypothetical protein
MQTNTKKTLAFTVNKVYNVQHKLNLVTNNNTSGANTMNNTNINAITVTSINANTKKVIAVGATKHAKDTIGYKIRFTDKSATARVNTLIATKEHSDYLFYTLNVQASELAGALLASERVEHNEQHESAFSAFISKFSASEQEKAREEINTNGVEIIAVLK